MHSDRVSTTGTEGRKSSKPIMEKRRRARINASLAELKSLLLEVIKKEGARHSKMEKADILEMAVKHLRQVQRQQYTSGGTDPTLSDKYRLGFNECAQEVSRYLGAADDDDAELRARLLNHLANCITSSDSPSPLSTPSSSPAPPLGHVSSSSTGSLVGSSGGGVVTPVTPIPVRPMPKPGGVSGLSLLAQADPGGNSPPTAAAAAVLVPTTEINNNNVALANNNVVSSLPNGVLSGADLRNGSSHQMTLSPAAASSPTSFPVGRKVMGEMQVVGAKPGGGGGGEGVALVLPANMMTGGPLPSYIIPLYASPHPLSAASISLTPGTALPPAANLSLIPTNAQPATAGALPLSLPVMATTTPSPTTAQVSSAPSLVTLTPGAALSPAVLPPASVGHVIATGLEAAPLTLQAATTVYSAAPPCSVSSSTITPPSSLPASSAGVNGLCLSLAARPHAQGSAGALPSVDGCVWRPWAASLHN